MYRDLLCQARTPASHNSKTARFESIRWKHRDKVCQSELRVLVAGGPTKQFRFARAIQARGFHRCVGPAHRGRFEPSQQRRLHRPLRFNLFGFGSKLASVSSPKQNPCDIEPRFAVNVGWLGLRLSAASGWALTLPKLPRPLS